MQNSIKLLNLNSYRFTKLVRKPKQYWTCHFGS